MIIDVTVKPNSKKGPLVQPSLEGKLLVYVREPAVDGEANRAVQKLLSEYYNTSKSRVQIIGGLSSKLKSYRIDIN